jgi:proton-dependent oligopeptide transporter, POT family
MKGLIMIYAQFQNGIASAIEFALVSVTVENKFTWLFGSFGLVTWTLFYLTCVTYTRREYPTAFCYVYICIDLSSFRDLDTQETAMNAIGTGERYGFKDAEKEQDGVTA